MRLQEIIQKAQSGLTSAPVFAEPVRIDGLVVIPAAKVSGGGGGGEGTEPEGGQQGAGGGFGMVAQPVGALVIRDGEVTWQRAFDVNKAVAAGAAVAIVALLVARSIVRQVMRERAG